jgi:hypothetical protein
MADDPELGRTSILEICFVEIMQNFREKIVHS